MFCGGKVKQCEGEKSELSASCFYELFMRLFRIVSVMHLHAFDGCHSGGVMGIVSEGCVKVWNEDSIQKNGHNARDHLFCHQITKSPIVWSLDQDSPKSRRPTTEQRRQGRAQRSRRYT